MTAPDNTPEAVERLARAICAETCAFYGDPPCWRISDEWPAESCDEPGCLALAQAVASETEDALRALAAENERLRVALSDAAAALSEAQDYIRLRADLLYVVRSALTLARTTLKGEDG